MATAASTITGVKVEYLEFPAVVTPPASTKSYFLGGAGISYFIMIITTAYTSYVVFTTTKIKFREGSLLTLMHINSSTKYFSDGFRDLPETVTIFGTYNQLEIS